MHRPVRQFPLSLALLCAALLGAVTGGCKSPRGASPSERRAAVDDMLLETLDRLYELDPEVRVEIENAPGYAVFSSVSATVLFVGGGNGYGVLIDNDTGERTYMRTAELGVGFGVGVQDLRAVFVFRDRETLERFGTAGWEFGGQAQAEMSSEEGGASAQGETSLSSPMRIYRITDAGVALSARIDGTRFWPDPRLN